MPSAGTQSSFSSNWKLALVPSKRTHRTSEIRKVATEVISAALRQFRSTASLGPFTTRQKNAPTSGRKVTTERIGQLDIRLPRRQHEVRDEACHADQHHERIVVEVAALETAQHARHVLRPRRDVVRAETVDHRTIALLPQDAADHERRSDGKRVVDFVEVPF